MTSVPLIDAAEIARLIGPADAVDAICEALATDLDIEQDAPRLFSPLRQGEFLLMPTESPAHAGIKVVTVAPENSAKGLPKIQAWYLLFDAETLSPAGILEGASLTLLRTPAVTAAAVRALLAADPRGPREGIERLVVIGSGPQTIAHVETLAAVLPIGEVVIVGRTPERVSATVTALAAHGARAGERSDLAGADVVVTATSSSTPVVELSDLDPDAVVAAIGAHGEHHRELGADLIRGADLVVEARASAWRENGNLLSARTRAEWQSGEQPVTNLKELVANGITRRAGHPAIYTGVGMSWEDLAVVERILRAAADEGDHS